MVRQRTFGLARGRLEAKGRQAEAKVLERFVRVFCESRHAPGSGRICGECSELLSYALRRLAACPFDPKPKCKACPAHCYRPGQRRRIREVMRFSGIHFVKRGRLDWLVRYFLM